MNKLHYVRAYKLDLGLTVKPTHGRVHKCHSHVYVNIELRYQEDGKVELSICGSMVGYGSCGQCLDTINEYGVKYKRAWDDIYRWWNLYHMNGMHAECEHQHELGWDKEASESITIYKYTIKPSYWDKYQKIQQYVIDCAKKNIPVDLPQLDRDLLTAPLSIETTNPEPPNSFFILQETKTTKRGWLYHSSYDSGERNVCKSEKGILCKPCPVCGYKYGTSWNHRDIPENVLRDIEDVCKRGLDHWYAEN